MIQRIMKMTLVAVNHCIIVLRVPGFRKRLTTWTTQHGIPPFTVGRLGIFKPTVASPLSRFTMLWMFLFSKHQTPPRMDLSLCDPTSCRPWTSQTDSFLSVFVFSRCMDHIGMIQIFPIALTFLMRKLNERLLDPCRCIYRRNTNGPLTTKQTFPIGIRVFDIKRTFPERTNIDFILQQSVWQAFTGYSSNNRLHAASIVATDDGPTSCSANLVAIAWLFQWQPPWVHPLKHQRWPCWCPKTDFWTPYIPWSSTGRKRMQMWHYQLTCHREETRFSCLMLENITKPLGKPEWSLRKTFCQLSKPLYIVIFLKLSMSFGTNQRCRDWISYQPITFKFGSYDHRKIIGTSFWTDFESVPISFSRSTLCRQQIYSFSRREGSKIPPSRCYLKKIFTNTQWNWRRFPRTNCWVSLLTLKTARQPIIYQSLGKPEAMPRHREP